MAISSSSPSSDIKKRNFHADIFSIGMLTAQNRTKQVRIVNLTSRVSENHLKEMSQIIGTVCTVDIRDGTGILSFYSEEHAEKFVEYFDGSSIDKRRVQVMQISCDCINKTAPLKYFDLKPSITIYDQENLISNFNSDECFVGEFWLAILITNCSIDEDSFNPLSCLLFTDLYNKSATSIQSFFRSFIARKQYNKAIVAIRRIQTCWRRYYSQKTFLQLKANVILIQKYIRGFLIRNRLKISESSPPIVVQYLTPLVSTAHLMEIASLVGKVRNVYIKNRKGFIQFFHNEHAAKFINHFDGGSIDKKKMAVYCRIENANAATILQACWRGYKTRQRFLNLKACIIIVQKYVRRYIATKNVIKLRSHAILSKNEDPLVVVRNLTPRVTALHIIEIATNLGEVRNLKLIDGIALIVFKTKPQATKFFECFDGGFIDCQKVNVHIMRSEIGPLNDSAKKIQSTFKSWITRKLFLKKVHCITKIQNFWRGHIYRKRFLASIAGTKILQKYARGFLARKNFRIIRAKVIFLQRSFRAKLEFNQKIIPQIVRLQSLIRGFIVRKNYQNQIIKIVKIQAFFRMFLARKKYRFQISLIIKLQSQIRKFIAKRQYNKLMDAVIFLQYLWKKFLRRKSSPQTISRLWNLSSPIFNANVQCNNCYHLTGIPKINTKKQKLPELHSDRNKLQKLSNNSPTENNLRIVTPIPVLVDVKSFEEFPGTILEITKSPTEPLFSTLSNLFPSTSPTKRSFSNNEDQPKQDNVSLHF